VQNIRLLSFSPQQTQAKYTNISEPFLQLIKVTVQFFQILTFKTRILHAQISSHLRIASLSVAHNNAGIAADASQHDTPMVTELVWRNTNESYSGVIA
jgi:hypothetical protein